MATAPTTTFLTERELRAWKGFLRVHALVTKELDAELERIHGMSLSSYEVLLHLTHADEGRMRMSELADSVILSRSGLTRLVDRLEREGLLERCSCPSDARGFNACLTDAGRERFSAAQATHLDGVRRLIIARLDPAQQDAIGDAWDRIASPADGAGPCS